MTEIRISETPDRNPPEHRLKVTARSVVISEISVTATAGEDAVDFLLRQATERLRVFDQRVPRSYFHGDEERELPQEIQNPWGPGGMQDHRLG